MRSLHQLQDLADTQRLAEKLAPCLRCGDVVTLAGDLGAGKTTFAQFLIRQLSSADMEVTSPTFTLLQTYPVTLSDGGTCELYHYDLYRIEDPSQLAELGIEEALASVALIEWPEKLGNARVATALALSFSLADDGARSVTIEGDDLRFGDVV